MQTLDIISVNIWQILISLVNLLIIFLILKKFLYKPVKKVFRERQAALDEQYAKAEENEKIATVHKETWEQKIQSADAEAEKIVQNAVEEANKRSEEILLETKEKSEAIFRQTQENIALEQKKAEGTIRDEIADVSICLTEKILEREIRTKDHRKLIDSFIDEVGEKDE